MQPTGESVDQYRSAIDERLQHAVDLLSEPIVDHNTFVVQIVGPLSQEILHLKILSLKHDLNTLWRIWHRIEEILFIVSAKSLIDLERARALAHETCCTVMAKDGNFASSGENDAIEDALKRLDHYILEHTPAATGVLDRLQRRYGISVVHEHDGLRINLPEVSTPAQTLEIIEGLATLHGSPEGQNDWHVDLSKVDAPPMFLLASLHAFQDDLQAAGKTLTMSGSSN